jgi:hypothetical protein
MERTYGRQQIFQERRRLKILPRRVKKLYRCKKTWEAIMLLRAKKLKNTSEESEKTLQMQKNMGGDYASESKEA